MAIPTAGSSTRVYAAGYDLSAFFRNIKLTQGAKTVPTETFGASNDAPFGTLKNGVASGDGLYSGGVGEVDERLAAALGAQNVLITVALGDVLGNVAKGIQAVGTSHDTTIPVDGVVAIAAAFASNVQIERMLVLHPKAAEVAAGSGGVIDNAVQTVNGGVGYSHVFAIAGGNCTVKVQDSANNSTWADLLSFTLVAGAPASERKELAAGSTVRRYIRWTISGTFTSVTFQLSFGRR
jgi:hypothetical protein